MRQTITHKIEKAGRDFGKVFVITEMGARPAHRWATKAIFALLNSGVEIPDNLAGQGLAAIAVMGLQSLTAIPHAVAEPLLDELLGCVQVKQELVTRALIEADIEEAMTYFDLQRIVLTMHIEPFISGGAPNSVSTPMTQSPAA